MGNRIFDFINLHNGEDDKEKVLENVRSNISFRGSNLWILACAIIIASVGLNVNSTAVVIGAMLISPLMGPIVGAGFALGTYNFQLLKKSIKNLLIATAVSLVVSAIYFYVSPFKEVQSELASRTSPTIYDVLIAFFGGLVGVIAITRVEKGNPIPGVAIATALMPPLCTAGYGLATFNLTYFAGAFYLYSINCFFICIATYFVIKYLKYPAVSFLNRKYAKQLRYGITTLIFVMIIPSFYLAYSLWNERKFTNSVEYFLSSEFTNRGHLIVYKKLDYSSQPKKVEIAILNEKFSEAEIEEYNRRLSTFGLSSTELTFRQNDEDLKSEILNEINKTETRISEKDLRINKLGEELNRYKITDDGIVKELNIIFPTIQEISLGKLEKYPETDSVTMQCVMLYRSKEDIDEVKLKSWLEERFKSSEVVLIRQKIREPEAAGSNNNGRTR